MAAPRCRIVVLAKAPVAGLAKTRLAPALGVDGAAALAARLLAHALQAAREAAAAVDGGRVLLACAPDASHAAFHAERLRGSLDCIDQGDGDLGARMHRAFAAAFADPAVHAALLIGTDAPALDAARLRDAAAALTHHDAVFVPAHDGGYALIGLRGGAVFERAAPLFDAALPWSTPALMRETRAGVAAAGLRAHECAPVHDIDTPADLAHLPTAWRVAR